jgi:hypothetical protein
MGAKRPSPHESREAAPGVQASQVGIVIGVGQAAEECTGRRPPAFDDPAKRIGECQLEDSLCKVGRDGSSIHGGGLR